MKPLLRPSWRFLANAITEPLVSPTSATSYTFDVPVCGRRPVFRLVVDGTAYFANGWNRPWYADLTTGKLFPMGSVAPVTFSVTEDVLGSTFPPGHVRFYYFAFRNSDRLEETCPQLDANGVPGYTSTMVGTGDRTIAWKDPLDGRWTHVAIYVRRPNSDDVVKLAYVAIGDEVYTDNTPDNSLSTQIIDTYVPRTRPDYPPRFKAFAVHQGRVLAITGTDANVYFSDQVSPTGELTQTNFPSGNILGVEPDDGLGENVTIFSHYDVTVLVKRRGCYLLSGDSPDNYSFQRMYSGRGALSARSWCAVHSAYVLLDELGMYAWTPDSQPLVLGADPGNGTLSTMTPIWSRINRDAADMAHLTYKEALGFVEARIPLDRAPMSMHRVRWNVKYQRMESVDDCVSLDAGKLEDASAMEHDLRLDDLGFGWEEDYGTSEGIASGDANAAVFDSNPSDWIVFGPGTTDFDTDPLDGPEATPFQRRSADGDLVEDNRVFDSTQYAVTLLYWNDETFATPPDTFHVGVIHGIADFPHWEFGTSDRKIVPRYIMRFHPKDAAHGISPTLRVLTAPDERDLTLRRAIDMTNDDGWAIVPCWDRGFRLRLRAESYRAGDDFLVHAMTCELYGRRLRR